MMSSRWISRVLFLSLFLSGVALADDGRALKLAARAGDLAEVKKLVEAGAPVDVPGPWGGTALILATWHGTPEVVEYLLEKGADPDAQDRFFGSTPLGIALWQDGPEYRKAYLLLAAGASDRAAALDTALRDGNAKLARAAVESGAVHEYEAARLRESHPELEGELSEIFGGLKTNADPVAQIVSQTSPETSCKPGIRF